MRRKLVAGNWKMHGNSDSIETLMAGILAAEPAECCDIVVAPPFPYISQVRSLIAGAVTETAEQVTVAAQTCSGFEQGAHTGDVAASMLAEFGCRWVIVGHSERRSAGESDVVVKDQASQARAQGMTPIICIGETLAQRETGGAEAVVAAQLNAVLADVQATDVIAYEPVWAIGTGETATPEQAQAMHAFIRATVASRSEALAQQVRLLYGGSVKPDNAKTLFSQDDIDGGLIGGASLNADDFIAIIKATQE